MLFILVLSTFLEFYKHLRSPALGGQNFETALKVSLLPSQLLIREKSNIIEAIWKVEDETADPHRRATERNYTATTRNAMKIFHELRRDDRDGWRRTVHQGGQLYDELCGPIRSNEKYNMGVPRREDARKGRRLKANSRNETLTERAAEFTDDVHDELMTSS